MGTTAAGWPYVADDDFPLEYPVTSLALATKLETFDTVTSQVLTTQNGYVASFPVTVIRNGATAGITGQVQRTSGVSLVVLNPGVIPAAYRPPVSMGVPSIGANGSAIGPLFIVIIEPDGELRLVFPTGQAQSWTTATTVTFAAAWAV